MILTFLGADHEVTGSCHFLEACGLNILIDCGMEQGINKYENAELPIPYSDVDYVLVTHAHIDHVGLLPLIYARGFRGQIMATRATCDLCDIMLKDCAHIQESEAEWKNRKAMRAGKPEVTPIYTMNDAEGVLHHFVPCNYNEIIRLNDNLEIRFVDVGHLLGSASIEIWMKEDDCSKKIVFSGDIGNKNKPLIRSPQYIRQADYVVMESTYGDQFDDERICPITSLDENTHVLELWHGPTSAFKDMALQCLPRFFSASAEALRERGELDHDFLILVATSGDTGKAALAGFADAPGTGITVFYPEGKVSRVQNLQMSTQEGDNVAVCGIRGNFDDAQSAVKRIFADKELAERLEAAGTVLSSANSINVGRLVPQVVYYFAAYAQLLRAGAIEAGDAVEFCVPTGNFGDILAGYYAKRMGLPVAKLVVASDKNNVLADFLTTGVYDRNRPFFTTISPSMDILISSNLERMLYFLSDGDCELVASLMEQLAQTGRYEVPADLLAKIQSVFGCGWASEDEVRAAIKSCWDANGYVIDPHTACGYHVFEKVAPAEGAKARVLLSTASPYKFPRACCDALGLDVPEDDFEAMRVLEQATNTVAPTQLAELESKPVRFEGVCDVADMANYVEQAAKKMATN